MYALVVLSFIAAVLLVAGRRREGLQATATIKGPSYNQEDKDRIWGMLSEDTKNKLRTEAGGYNPEVGAKNMLADYMSQFFRTTYQPATSPITVSVIDNWVSNLGVSSTRRTALQDALKVYFVDQASATTGTTTSTTTTDKIKAPPYDDAERDRIWNMLPENVKASGRRYLELSSQIVGTRADNTLKNMIKDFLVSDFYLTKYSTATTPITNADVDNYVDSTFGNNTSNPPAQDAYELFARGVFKAYFVNQLAAGAAGATPPASGTATPSTPANTAAPAPSLYIQVKGQFDAKKQEYDAQIAKITGSDQITDADIAKLRNLNRELFGILETAIRALGESQSKEMETNTKALREALAKVEREYGVLTSESDRAETLRRIRQFEQVRSGDAISVYMIGLLVLAMALFIAMIFSQRVSTTMTMPPARPASTANLM
jgi:hypothetical protein